MKIIYYILIGLGILFLANVIPLILGVINWSRIPTSNGFVSGVIFGWILEIFIFVCLLIYTGVDNLIEKVRKP